jgi:hypothetical protein
MLKAKCALCILLCMAIPSALCQSDSDHDNARSAIAPASSPITLTYFGLHIHRPSKDTWPQVPFEEWRLWDSGANWHDLEPHRGEWNFAQLDSDVAMAEQHHVALLLTLGQSPQWASSRPKDPPQWIPGGAAPPTDEEDWKTYVRTVAVRYQGRIHAYEVWNEPNLRIFYTGTPEQMVDLAKDAYQIIHQVDPDALVVSPSVTSALTAVDYGIPWLDAYLGLGGGAWADVIGFHFYTINHRPEDAVTTIGRVNALLYRHGLHKPLWNTETGFYIQSNFDDVQKKVTASRVVLSQEEAIGYVMRAYLVNWACGVSRLYWYDWDSNVLGLGDDVGRRAKVAASGYGAIENWLLGWTMRGCSTDAAGNWTCELTEGGHTEWIVWNPLTTVAGTVPHGSHSTRYDTLSASGEAISGQLSRSGVVSYSPTPTRLR